MNSKSNDSHDSIEYDALSPAVKSFLREHLEIVKTKILVEALDLAKSEKRDSIEPEDIAEASKRFAPGKRIPNEVGAVGKFFSSLSPITIISAFLALVFGLLGLKGIQGTLDIAKIFAGAVVGSSGVTAVSSATSTLAMKRGQSGNQ